MENHELGIKELLRRPEPADFAILEATGGLEARVGSALAAAGIATAIVNPRQCETLPAPPAGWPRPTGWMPRCWCIFDAAVQPAARPFANAQAQALEVPVTRRRQLVEMLKAEKNRRSSAPKVSHRSIDGHIRWLEKRLSGFDDELANLIRYTPLWRERDELLRSVPGVGKMLSSTLLVHLPELGMLSASRSPHMPD